MDEDNNIEVISEEIQEVADPDMLSEEDQEVAETGVIENEQPTEQPQESTQPARTDMDSRFAQMRRENERASSTLNRYGEVLKNFGYTGGTPEEILDKVEAQYSGKSIDEVRAERIAKEQKIQEDDKLKNENAILRQMVNKQTIDNDLKELQKLDPNIKDIRDLGPKFIELKANDWGTQEAYHAVKAIEKATTVTPPPVVGKINSNTTGQKDFYTPEEVDRLSEAELDDPKVMEKVMKSMTKWK